MSRPDAVLFDGLGSNMSSIAERTTWTGRPREAPAVPSPAHARDGFVDLVAALDDGGVRMGLVTRDDGPRAAGWIATLGLADRLPVVVGGDRGLPGGPDPARLLAACRLLGVDPAGCVSIADGLDGVRAARAAGFALALAHVPAGAELPSWSGEADAVLRRFGDLASVWGDPARAVVRT